MTRSSACRCSSTPSTARLPPPGPGTLASDVGSRLAPIHRHARAVDETRLFGAEERDNVCHLGHAPEALHRQVAPDELSDALGVLLLPAVPAAALPQHGAGRDAVDRDAARRHLAPERRDEADLGR